MLSAWSKRKYESLTEAPQPAKVFRLRRNRTATTVLAVRSIIPPSEWAAALDRMPTGIHPNLRITARSLVPIRSIWRCFPHAADSGAGHHMADASDAGAHGNFQNSSILREPAHEGAGDLVGFGCGARVELMLSAPGRPLTLLARGPAGDAGVGLIKFWEGRKGGFIRIIIY
jgi:hypothetical protein